MSSKSTRPSPSESASGFPPGYKQIGNDGNMWEIKETSTGVRRWVKTGLPKNTNPMSKTIDSITYEFNVGDKVEIVQSGLGCHPNTKGQQAYITERGLYNSYLPGYKINRLDIHTNTKTGDLGGFIGEPSFVLVAASSINTITQPPIPDISAALVYKYNIGDIVKIIQSGCGCSGSSVNQEAVIIERGLCFGGPGYKINRTDISTNTQTGDYDGFIGEVSFELVQAAPTVKQKNQTKKRNMAKIKNMMPKKVSQEVRKIETSLINKNEVFRMLALAESTGLPLLLVGKPGVNLK